MPRYKLIIEYDGTGFAGWQVQPDQPTIQGELMKAARAFDQSDVAIYGAGRTDSGVHALAQVAHLDLTKDLDPLTVRDAFNHHLKPSRICVLDVERAHPEFHARFHALERRYLFRISDRRAPPTLETHRVWHVPVKLDVEKMHTAAQFLVGEHDFSTFRDNNCQAKSPVKRLDELSVLRAGDEIHLLLRARSFLHRQVRSITGTLVDVGRGKMRVDEVKTALDAADRAMCGPVSPPDGLYLTDVIYPEA